MSPPGKHSESPKQAQWLQNEATHWAFEPPWGSEIGSKSGREAITIEQVEMSRADEDQDGQTMVSHGLSLMKLISRAFPRGPIHNDSYKTSRSWRSLSKQ